MNPRSKSSSGEKRKSRRWPAVSVALMVLLYLLCAGGVAAVGAAGGEGGGTVGWVPTDTYRVMNFAVLAIALFFLLRKPVSQALNARIEGIKEQLATLEARKKEAEKALAEYDRKLAGLDQEAQLIVEEYIRQGKDARDRILKEAEGAADKLEQQARRNIEQEFEQARARLQSEVMEKAIGKAEEIIRQRINDQDQERLIDEYLEKVVA